MSDPQRYEIKTVTDFLAVPEDRIDGCLREFRAWLVMARTAPKLLNAIAASMQEGEPSVVFKPVECFSWVDDTDGEIGFDVLYPDEPGAEPTKHRVFTGTLSDEYRA